MSDSLLGIFSIRRRQAWPRLTAFVAVTRTNRMELNPGATWPVTTTVGVLDAVPNMPRRFVGAAHQLHAFNGAVNTCGITAIG